MTRTKFPRSPRAPFIRHLRWRVRAKLNPILGPSSLAEAYGRVLAGRKRRFQEVRQMLNDPERWHADRRAELARGDAARRSRP